MQCCIVLSICGLYPLSKWNLGLSWEFCGGCGTAQAEIKQPSFLPSLLSSFLSSFLPSLPVLYFICFFKLFKKINLFYLICIYLPASMSACCMHPWYYGRVEEGVGFPETGIVIDKLWSTMWVLELNVSALEKYPVLLTAELAFQSTFWWWWWWWLWWWWQGFMWPRLAFNADVVKDSLELLIVPLPHPEFWDYRCSLPHLYIFC